MADSGVFGSATIPMGLPPKTSAPPPESGTVGERIMIPELNIEPWIERSIQIFTAIAAQFLIQRLQATSSDASIVVLLVLILGMFFFIELDHTVQKYQTATVVRTRGQRFENITNPGSRTFHRQHAENGRYRRCKDPSHGISLTLH